MKAKETGVHYDRIALWWQEQHLHSTYGLAALEKAIQFTENKSAALDIGCGSSGRDREVKDGKRIAAIQIDDANGERVIAGALRDEVGKIVELVAGQRP